MLAHAKQSIERLVARDTRLFTACAMRGTRGGIVK